MGIYKSQQNSGKPSKYQDRDKKIQAYVRNA